MKKNFIRDTYMYFLILAVAVGITVSGIIYRQHFWKMLPLYVSLVVMLFQSNASRLAPLIGGVNSILYAMVDWSYGLYSSALSALFMSCPVQIITFILWTRRKDGATTRFRRMNKCQRIILVCSIVLAYVPCLILNIRAGATLAPLDAYSFIGGLAVLILTMFAYTEYTYLSLFGCVVTILMNVLLTADSPDRLSYLIFSVYSAICTVRAVFSVRKIYQKQINEGKIKTNDLEEEKL